MKENEKILLVLDCLLKVVLKFWLIKDISHFKINIFFSIEIILKNLELIFMWHNLCTDPKNKF
jgi:hypothetical protein